MGFLHTGFEEDGKKVDNTPVHSGSVLYGEGRNNDWMEVPMEYDCIVEELLPPRSVQSLGYDRL